MLPVDYTQDARVVMTPDPRGADFRFSAVRGKRQIAQTVAMPAERRNSELCPHKITEGIMRIEAQCPVSPVAISFAFPGPLRNALMRLGWSKLDLACCTKININIICDIVEVGRTPTKKEANAIQRALGMAGEYVDVLELWPSSFARSRYGREGHTCPAIQFESIFDNPDAMEYAAPEYESEELEETVEIVLSSLPKRAYEILKLRYWKNETHEQIGDALGVSRQRIYQIEMDAFRTLKQPAWVRKLGTYIRRYNKVGSELRVTGSPELLMKSGDGTQSKEAATGFSMERLSFIQGRSTTTA